MNTLKFEVYKNTLKRRDGFNPVLGEKKYSKVKCYFTDNDWDNCSLVTANFMTDKDNVVKNTVSLTEDKTAVFDIPANLDGNKIYFSITGSCTSDDENTTTLNTNIIGIDRQKGMLPSATTNMNLYEKIIGLVNSVVSSLKSTVSQLAERLQSAETALAGKANTTDVNAALAEKLNSVDILNIEPSVNIVSLSNSTQTAGGVTAEVSNNKIIVSGTSTATKSIYLPLKKAVTLTAGLPYCLSLQNFSTTNTGIVVYPCNGTTVLDSWLLSEASALNKLVAVYTPTETATVDNIRLHIATGRTVDNSFNIQIEQNNKSTVWSDPDNFASATIKDEYYGEYVINKADKAGTLTGYGITDGVSTEIFDYSATRNLADIADTSVAKLGINVRSFDNLITLSGTSNATGYIYLPLKNPISLNAGTRYTLSLQNFLTKNAGCVIYPCNGETVINSGWLLSEAAGLKGNVSTFSATENAEVNSIRIHCAAGNTVDNSFNIQIEEGSVSTSYVKPFETKIKPKYIDTVGDYKMNYLYVSNDYDGNTDGFGKKYFKTILDANNSIKDNSRNNRYTIIVAHGTYTDLQEKYAGVSDVGLVGYRGIMTKDYVYYESENIYNPAATVIKWDGATGFDKSTLKSEDIIKKCPFHLDLNVHTHIKGFTFDCKNIRYGIHLESGGTGYATDWTISNCIFIWGGRADCTDYINKTTVPVFGCGHSFGETGLIENCKIIPTHCTIGYQSHDNADNSDFGLPIKVGAKITIKDCDFGGTEIQARTLKGAYADTPNVLTIDNCINISAINKMYAAPADHCDWDIKGVS